MYLPSEVYLPFEVYKARVGVAAHELRGVLHVDLLHQHVLHASHEARGAFEGVEGGEAVDALQAVLLDVLR